MSPMTSPRSVKDTKINRANSLLVHRVIRIIEDLSERMAKHSGSLVE